MQYIFLQPQPAEAPQDEPEPDQALEPLPDQYQQQQDPTFLQDQLGEALHPQPLDEPLEDQPDEPAEPPACRPASGAGHKSEHGEGERGASNYSKFSEVDIKKELGPSQDLSQSFLQKCKAHLGTIEQEYGVMFKLRCEIDALNMGFKEKLGLHKEASLANCFRALRQLVGRKQTLELNYDENTTEIEIDENADDDPKLAVDKFNSMLKKCHELRDKLKEARGRVETELAEFERESAKVQIQATVKASERARKQLHLLEDWEKDADDIICDAETSSGKLSKNYTFKQAFLEE